jgi:hypothetical protein
MIYEETVTQQITYSLNDITDWAKTFAAKQLNITRDEITDKMISINPENLKDVGITIIHTKKTSNTKH